VLPFLTKIDYVMAGIMDRKRLVYRLGDNVRIKSGPFVMFRGKVEGINQSKSLLKVKLEIFGRDTPIKVSFFDAEKMESQPPTTPGPTHN
jgi:transcription antitermination factor NusG